MRWPWVKRSHADYLRRLYRERNQVILDLERHVAEARGARDAMQDALRRSEVERTELQATLLRVGFGYAPFPDPTPAEQSPVTTDESREEKAAEITVGMSAEQVQRLYAQEALGLYGSNLRKIRDHVERKMAEYFQFRNRAPILSPAEAEAAAKVAADVEAAIAEGRAAAEKE